MPEELFQQPRHQYSKPVRGNRQVIERPNRAAEILSSLFRSQSPRFAHGTGGHYRSAFCCNSRSSFSRAAIFALRAVCSRW